MRKRYLAVAMAVLAGLLVVYMVQAIAGKIELGPLERHWEELMLKGMHIFYREGQPVENSFRDSFEKAQGSPSSASLTTHGILVEDLRETRLLFWRNGGWRIEGGLLAKIDTVELYGKEVARRKVYFVFNPAYLHSAPEETRGYEFFLLRRQHGASRADLLRKWAFRSDEVSYQEDPFGDVREFLEYDPVIRVAIVTIKGLRRPFEERVNLSKEVRS